MVYSENPKTGTLEGGRVRRREERKVRLKDVRKVEREKAELPPPSGIMQASFGYTLPKLKIPLAETITTVT